MIQLRIARVVEDVQSEDAPPLARDVPVSEVPPEQLGIGRTVQVDAFAERTTSEKVLLPVRLSPPLVVPAPPPDGLDGDAMQDCFVRVAHP
jgi:hypothetical protein